MCRYDKENPDHTDERSITLLNTETISGTTGGCNLRTRRKILPTKYKSEHLQRHQNEA